MDRCMVVSVVVFGCDVWREAGEAGVRVGVLGGGGGGAGPFHNLDRSAVHRAIISSRSTISGPSRLRF
jgi:hypothetical protein